MSAVSNKDVNNRGPVHQKVLLIEFVITDRFHCGIFFPYIQGWLRENGIVAKTFRFGLKASSAMLEEGSDGATLPANDFTHLVKVTGSFKPSHILFSHKPANILVKEVFNKNRKIAYQSRMDRVKSVFGDEMAFPQWFNGRVSNAINVFGFNRPDFESQPGNKEAEHYRPLPHLLCGIDCRYNKPISNNIYFKKLNLSEYKIQKGCAFCMRPIFSHKNSFTEDAFVKLRHQLKQAYVTCKWGENRPRYRILGEEIFFKLEEFAKVIEELNLNNSDFLFDCRVDHVVKLEKKIESALTRMKGSGNRIQICLIGIENFSQDELNRFNKGATTETIIKMVGILKRLETDYPDTFDYREYGGFSTILYTPWTTLENIEFNLALVEHLGIEKTCGKLLTSRLRLYPELPLTKLAEKDGLLRDAYKDSVLDTAKRNFYPKEIPWKFKDSKAEVFNRIAARLYADDSLLDDALYKFIRKWHGELCVPNKTPLTVSRIILKELKYGNSTKNLHEVLERINKKTKDADCAGSFSKEPLTYGIKEAEFILMKKNIRKVGRIENVPAEKSKKVCLELKKVFGDELVVEYAGLLRSRFSKDECDIFYGFDKDEVTEAVRLTKFIQESFDVKRKQEAVVRVGVLLGYPECCAKAYAHASAFEWRYNERLHLKHRVKAAGKVRPEVNPFAGLCLKYVPCSLDCCGTLNRARLLLKELTRLKGKSFAEKLLEECKKPVFFLFDVEASAFVVLDPLGKPSEGKQFRYRAIEKIGNDERLTYILAGDLMKIEKGCISIYSSGKKLYDFILNAYIWWHKKAFHTEFWKLYSDIKHMEVTDRFCEGNYGRFFDETKHILSKSSSLISSKTGFVFKDLIPLEQNSVKFIIENKQGEIELLIEPVGKAKRPFLAGKYYTLTFGKQIPVIDQNKIKSVVFILKVMDVFKSKMAEIVLA